MRVLGGIELLEDGNELTFTNGRLWLQFDRHSGAWTGLTLTAGGESLIQADGLASTADVRVDGVWLVAERGACLLRAATSADAEHGTASLHLAYQLAPLPQGAEPSYELQLSYTLDAHGARLDRSALLLALPGAQASSQHLEGFRFGVPRAAVGDPGASVVDAPGPFPYWDRDEGARTFIPIGTPFVSLEERALPFFSAPDTGFGILALSDAKAGICLASWMDTGGRSGYEPMLEREGDRLSMSFREDLTQRLVPGSWVRSGTHRLVLSPSLPMALAAYREMAELVMPLRPDPPAWIDDLVLLEVMPAYFEGGLREIAARLPFYSAIGFTALHLMPHWLGGYSPIDFYAVDPRYGTREDLQALVRAAHTLGMRVLFDLVIHGFNQASPVIGEHPELFCRDAEGSLALHPTWRSVSTDWANPRYQAYMAQLARHHVDVYDIDGYRVDAASFKGPNWDPQLPYPAYRSGSAAAEVIEAMLAEMRKTKPDAVMLNEVFGPRFYTVCDLAHDNMTMGPQLFLEQLDAGRATAATYKAHLAAIVDALPRGARRVFFARNHDTSWFYHFGGYTPTFLALDAIHALFALPEVFAGDPKHGPSPDDDPAIFRQYATLFQLRRRFPELTYGERYLRQVTCDRDAIFTGLRCWHGHCTLVVISLSPNAEDACVGLPAAAQGFAHPPIVFDGITGQTVDGSWSDRATLRLRVEPCQVVLARW